jgi:hypothetical protein
MKLPNTSLLSATAAIAVLAMAPFSQAQFVTIDEWTFNNDASPQLSDQGTSLQGRWTDAAQAVSQVPGDNAFILAPTNQFFTGRIALSSPIDAVSYSSARITVSYTSLDFSANPAQNSQLQFRMWDDDGGTDEWIGLSIQDNFNNDKVFGRINRGPAFGGGGLNAGRLVNGLTDIAPTNTPRTVVMEIDWVNDEVRMSSPAWQFSNNGPTGTFTNSLSLASIGQIDKIQSNFNAWTLGDTITVDNVLVEGFLIPEPTSFALVGLGALSMFLIRRKK